MANSFAVCTAFSSHIRVEDGSSQQKSSNYPRVVLPPGRAFLLSGTHGNAYNQTESKNRRTWKWCHGGVKTEGNTVAMADDVFGGDGDGATEASNGVCDEASRGSRQVILGGILGESNSGTSIGQGSGCRSYDSYERDTFDDGAGSTQGSGEMLHTGGKHGETAPDPREQGARDPSCSKAPHFHPVHGKTEKCSDHSERSRLADACEESHGNNRVDVSFEAVGRRKPKRENNITNNGRHGNHDNNTNTETTTPKTRDEQTGTQPCPTVPYQPNDSRERPAIAWSSCPPARWPSPRSVQLSHGYIFYAYEAGDYVKKRCSDERYTKSGGRGCRGLSRRRRKPGPRKRQIRPPSSRQKKVSVTTVVGPSRGEAGDTTEGHRRGMSLGHEEEEGGMANGSAATGRELYEMGDSANEERYVPWKQQSAEPVQEESFASNSRHLSRGDTVNHLWQPNDKGVHSRGGERSRDGGGGHDLSGGLPMMERDMTGAIVAVWLAWGVRIDAAREKLRQEERWLKAAHRTEIKELGRFISVESSGRNGETGITPEILEYVAQEAALREYGNADMAERIRGEALQARTKHIAQRRDVVRRRRPLLEAALRQQQVAELFLVRGSAEKIESKLVRARDESVRLLQLHLSRARRLVSAGLAARATSYRPRRSNTSNRQIPILLEADLLKLGKVLLLAQDTANDSIARALRMPEGERGRSVHANVARGVTKTQSTRRASPAKAETVNDEPTSLHGHDALPTLPYRKKTCDESFSRLSGVEGTGAEVNGPTRGRHGATNAASPASSRPRRTPQVRTSNRADTDTDTAIAQAIDCLWCGPASMNRRQRRQCPVPGRSPQRCSNFRNPENLRPYARPVSSPEAAAHHGEFLQQPHSHVSVTGRNASPSNRSCQNACGDSESHTKVSRFAAGRSTSVSPLGNAVECSDAAVAVGIPGTASGLDLFRSPKDQLFDDKHRLLIRGGSGFTAPHSHFCSWECAGRWNAAFSPAQTRHERGLKIDLAAGRIIRK